MPLSEGTRRRTAEELSDYVCQLGELLLRYGCPSYRVESLIRTVAELEGHEARAFALPTALFVTVEPRDGGVRVAPVHRMARVNQWGIDPAALARRPSSTTWRTERTIEQRARILRCSWHGPRPARHGRSTRRFPHEQAAAVLFRSSAVDVAPPP
jgi:hypothetical protein